MTTYILYNYGGGHDGGGANSKYILSYNTN